MVEERRATPRVRAYHPVRLSLVNAPGVVETLTKDLAVGGLRSLSTAALPVASAVRIELILSTEREPVRVRGRVAWFRTIPESDQFDVGIAFDDLSDADKRRLSAYVERASTPAASVEPSPTL